MGTVGFGSVFILLVMIALYLLPGIIASSRDHASAMGIWLLNIFLGWTLVGWVAALVWSVTGGNLPAPAVTQATKTCPKCAETILAAAVKCKHCGSEL